MVIDQQQTKEGYSTENGQETVQLSKALRHLMMLFYMGYWMAHILMTTSTPTYISQLGQHCYSVCCFPYFLPY